MVAGIYAAKFISNSNLMGTGIVVMDGATLHGGDLGFYYKGKYRLLDNGISATVDLKHYQGPVKSVFPSSATAYRLNLNGVPQQHGFTLSGAVEGQPNHMVQIELTKLSELVDQ